MTEPTIARPQIDPTLKALVDAFPLTFKASDGVEVARARLRQLKAPPEMLPDLRIENHMANGVPVRVYWPPAESGNLPIVVFYHGGGFALGDLETHDPVARAHAVGADAIVVSVDYRLAPEHPFPTGPDDCWAALQWVAAHAGELGGDPDRIAVAGDSAGGNLAAVTAQRARDEGGPPLVFQLLWYPTITADTPILDRDVIDAFMSWYIPGVNLSDPKSLPVALAPCNAADLSGLPPAFIGSAEHDPLRDDAALYAKLLNEAGTPAELSNEGTLTHGYVSFALIIPAAAEATNRGLAALKAALH
jgi:acetyl esterase